MTSGVVTGMFRATGALLPASFMVFIFCVSLWQIVSGAFGFDPFLGFDSFSLRFLLDALLRDDVWVATQTSLRIAGVVTLLVVFLGGGLAWLVAFSRSTVRISGALLRLPLAIPVLVSASIALLLFDQGGFLARLCYLVGVIETQADFPAVIGAPSGAGIVVGYVLREVPFAALLILTPLVRIRERYRTVTASLGASEGAFVLRVVLPLLMPSLLSTSLLVFTYTLSAVEIPLSLGPTWPKPLPVLAWQAYGSVVPVEKLSAFSLALLQLVISALGAVGFLLGEAWARRREALE